VSFASHRLADIPAASFQQVVAQNPVILVPLGSHEDHGPFLPMGDYLLADMLGERMAQAASAAGVLTFVAPALPFGAADYFGASAGGLALSPATFRSVLGDLLAGLLRHGLTRIICLNGHGGNAPIIHEVTLGLRHARDIVIPSFYLWKIARQIMEGRVADDGQFGHGGEPIMSVTRALRGGLVAAEGEIAQPVRSECLDLPVTGFGTVGFKGVQIDVPAGYDQTPNDVVGKAWPKSSAAFGGEIADALVAVGAEFIVHFARLSNASGVS
jgi:creatinine amidohydrolase